jgi:hypothetical protein
MVEPVLLPAKVGYMQLPRNRMRICFVLERGRRNYSYDSYEEWLSSAPSLLNKAYNLILFILIIG